MNSRPKSTTTLLWDTLVDKKMTPEGQLTAVKKLIEEKADPVEAFMCAGETGNTLVITHLIDSGVPVNSLRKTYEERDAEEWGKEIRPQIKEKIAQHRAKGIGETALSFAAHNGQLEIVNLLLASKADPNIRNEYRQNALARALSSPRPRHESDDPINLYELAQKNVVDITKSLLAAKAQPEFKYTVTKTVSTQPVEPSERIVVIYPPPEEEAGDKKEVPKWKRITTFEDFYQTSTSYCYPLPKPLSNPIITSWEKSETTLMNIFGYSSPIVTQLTQLLLDAKCNPNLVCTREDHIEGEDTPLTKFIQAGWLDTGKILIEHKAEINPEFFKKPLHAAVSLATQDDFDSTPKHTEQSLSFVKYLLELKANPYKTEHNQTLLFSVNYQTSHPYPELFQNLLQLGIDVNHQDNLGKTVLFRATQDLTATKMLLDQNAEVNHKDLGGYTPLMSVIKERSWGSAGLDVVNLLLEYKAEIDTGAHSYGKPTPLSLALDCHNFSILKSLCQSKHFTSNLPGHSYGIYMYVKQMFSYVVEYIFNHRDFFADSMTLLLSKDFHPEWGKSELFDTAINFASGEEQKCLKPPRDEQYRSLFIFDVFLKMDVFSKQLTGTLFLYLLNCDQTEPLIKPCLDRFFSQQRRIRQNQSQYQEYRVLTGPLYTFLTAYVAGLNWLTDTFKQNTFNELDKTFNELNDGKRDILTLNLIKLVMEYIAPLHCMDGDVRVQTVWELFPPHIQATAEPEFDADRRLVFKSS